MSELTVSSAQLREFTAMVLEQLPVPNGGATITKASSSVKMEFTEDGFIKGTGRSTFEFSNGQTVRTTWHVLVVGIETWVVVDPEEVA